MPMIVCLFLLIWQLYLRCDDAQVTSEHLSQLRIEVREMVDDSGEIHPMIGTLARNQFHDCAGILAVGDNENRIGCNGCLNMVDPHNAGLLKPVIEPMEVLYVNGGYNELMSRADFWITVTTLAFEYGSDLARMNNDCNDDIWELPIFYFGRLDCENSPYSDPLVILTDLPDPEWLWTTQSAYMYNHFDPGFTSDESVALIGLHTLGECHLNVSGYKNQWVDESDYLDNEFFRDLIQPSINWTQIQLTETGQYQWVHGEFLPDIEHNMMLNVDMSMWITLLGNFDEENGGGPVTCTFTGENRCEFQFTTEEIVIEYAIDNQRWLDDLTDVWQKLVLQGYDPNDLQMVILDSFDDESSESSSESSSD